MSIQNLVVVLQLTGCKGPVTEISGGSSCCFTAGGASMLVALGPTLRAPVMQVDPVLPAADDGHCGHGHQVPERCHGGHPQRA